MNVIMFNTFKVASRLPLVQVASYFNIKNDAWKEYVKIDSEEIEKILKYVSSSKSVYLYKYGCITFVNFKYHEIQQFFEYLNKIYVDLDNKLISKFSETHVMTVDNDGMVRLWEDAEELYPFNDTMVDTAATVLAKSTELHKIETELNNVLDEAENLINYLNIGRLRANSRKVISIIAQCTRFKYRSIESVRLLDRPPEVDKTIETKQVFNELSEFFELNDRYVTMQSRTDVLDSITAEYFSYKSDQAERRLLIFEIMLLAIFPLMHFIG
jgi:uncharacterized Rmd1/YagE family protein